MQYKYIYAPTSQVAIKPGSQDLLQVSFPPVHKDLLISCAFLNTQERIYVFVKINIFLMQWRSWGAKGAVWPGWHITAIALLHACQLSQYVQETHTERGVLLHLRKSWQVSHLHTSMCPDGVGSEAVPAPCAVGEDCNVQRGSRCNSLDQS